jgi:hypothetical protein
MTVGCSAAQAAPASCDLVLATRITAKGRWQYAVQLTAENVSTRSVAFVLPDRCPAGPLDLEGLPDGYDYYQTCNAGACLGPRGVQTVQLAPREKRSLVSIVLSAAGNACNPQLDPGLYQVRPVAPPLAGVRICVEPARLDLRQWKPKPVPVAVSPAEPPPPPASEPSAAPDACT